MKLKKVLILSVSFVLVSMLVSCTCYKQEPTFTWPTTSAGTAISTTAVEVTGDKGETLKVVFDRKSGKCLQSYVNGEPTNCKGPKLSETYFCTPPDSNHSVNTDMNGDGKLDVYCGKVKLLTEGTDIQFEADSADRNWKCKIIGGCAICY